MKRIYLIGAALLLALGTPAMAQHVGPYVGGYAGGNMIIPASGNDDKGTFNLTLKPAVQFGGVLGWDLPPDNPVGEGRVELEYTRRGNTLDKVGFKSGEVKADGTISMDSLLLNCFYVYHDKTILAPYFGVGLGVARITADNLRVPGAPLGSGKSTVFAYQLGLGVDVALNEKVTLDLGYRFLGTSSPEFVEAGGTKFKTELFNQSVLLGVRLGF